MTATITKPRRGRLRVIDGKRDGKALAARRQLVNCFLDAVDVLPPGWHTNMKVDHSNTRVSNAASIMFSLARYATSRQSAGDKESNEWGPEGEAFDVLMTDATLTDRSHRAKVIANREKRVAELRKATAGTYSACLRDRGIYVSQEAIEAALERVVPSTPTGRTPLEIAAETTWGRGTGFDAPSAC